MSREHRRLPRLRGQDAADQASGEVDSELAFHLERLTEAFMRDGLDEASARAAALRRFGDLDNARAGLSQRARAREQRTRRSEWLGELQQDVRYALRTLQRNPAFAVVSVLTLALGIGANTAMFGVAHGILFRPLPYAHPDRLVMLWQNNTLEGDARYPFSPANYRDLIEQSQALASVAAYTPGSDITVEVQGTPERVKSALISTEFLEVVGVQPVLGQPFGQAAGVTGAARVALLGDGYWRRRFAADPGVIGTQILQFGMPITIVGVLPPGFTVPTVDAVDLVQAIQYAPNYWAVRARHGMRLIARLREGATVEGARAEANRIFAQLEEIHPATNRGMRVTLLDVRTALVGNVRAALLVLLGAVSLVLFVACANITNLLLARANQRGPEFSIRAALGAGRARIVRQMLTESALLSLLGASAGLLLAALLVRGVRVLGPATLPMLNRVELSGPVLLFALALTAFTALLVGILPALQGAAARLAALRANTRGGSASRSHQRTRRALVVAQVALSLVLLCGGGLLVRSYNATMAVDPGFNTERVLTFTTMKMGNDTQRLQFYQDLERRLAATPGVQAVGGVTQLPLTGAGGRAEAHVEGHSWGGNKPPELRVRSVTDGYFDVMGLRLLRGRGFNSSDRQGDVSPIILNQEAATRLFAARDPVGARVRLGPDSTAAWFPVIGIVENARNQSLSEAVQPEVYAPHSRLASPMMTMALRTAVPPLSVAGQVRAHVSALDPSIYVTDLRTTEQLIAASVAQPRFIMLLLTGFALLSLIVSLIGTYGVLAFFVASRKREIGIRMALGAQRSTILRLIVGEGARLASLGMVLGLIMALLATRLLEGMLFQVKPADPVTFGATAVIIAFTTLVASGVPALAAARLQPESVMRGE